MAYIAPNSTIRFHQNVPLDNTYDHTLYFASLSAQETYFSYIDAVTPANSRVGLTLSNYSYQRHTRDSIKVAVPIETIVNYSYMSFKNTSFENKWFYCFITNMEYVNNNATIVYYEIDVMQTYVINDVTFEQCYIERQHTITDNIGDNTQPEPIGACEYVFADAVGYGDSATHVIGGVDDRYSDMSIVVACTFTGRQTTGEITYTQLDPNSLEYYYKVILPNGTMWGLSANPNDGGSWIPSMGYSKVKITIPPTQNTTPVPLAFLKSLDNFYSGGAIDYCYGTVEQFIPSDSTVEVDIPADCNYIWIEYGVDDVVYTPVYLGLGKTASWAFNSNMYGGLYGGCYSGVQLIIFPATISGAESCTKFLSDASAVPNLIDGIISIFMIPTCFTKTLQTSTPENFATRITKYYSWTINGTAPKNKKIYTAPYTMLHVVNSDGKTADFSFEFSKNSDFYSTVDDHSIVFLNEGLAMPVSEVRILPECYKGLQFNRNETFEIENYPQCSFTTDSYKAWLAMNSSRMNLENGMAIANGVLSVLGTANSIKTTKALASTKKQATRAAGSQVAGELSMGGSVIDAIGTIAGNLIEKKLASTMPAHANGQNTGVLNVSTHQFGFHYYYCRPRDEYARIIDDFFTRYGYAINQNAVPNLCARTRFTYIKTIDCTISANMPNEYSQKIVDIMNKGITFWNDKTAIGNYEIANNIIPG